MSNRSSAVAASIRSSASVSRSSTRVASFARTIDWATARFLELWRLLPLPCAKITRPDAPAGTRRSASSVTESTGIFTDSAVSPDLTVAVFATP